MLTMTIKATTDEAVERLMKAMAAALTPAELEEFKKNMMAEIERVEKKKTRKAKANK